MLFTGVAMGAPLESAWGTGPTLTTRREGIGLAAVGAKLYAVGGCKDEGCFDDADDTWVLASVEVLDTSAATPAWVAGPSMAAKRQLFGLAAVGAKTLRNL